MNNDIKKLDNKDFEVIKPDKENKYPKAFLPLPNKDNINTNIVILEAFKALAGKVGLIWYEDSLELSRMPDLHEFRAKILKNYSYNSYNIDSINNLNIILKHLYTIKITL